MKHKLYNRLLSLALAVGLVIGMLPSAAAVDTVGDGAGQPVTFADPDSPLKLDKTVTDNGNNTYTVNLEAYTTGTVTSETKTKPVDIVLVLDQSGSMANNFDGTGHDDYWDDDEEQRQYALKQAVNNFIDAITMNDQDILTNIHHPVKKSPRHDTPQIEGTDNCSQNQHAIKHPHIIVVNGRNKKRGNQYPHQQLTIRGFQSPCTHPVVYHRHNSDSAYRNNGHIKRKKERENQGHRRNGIDL